MTETAKINYTEQQTAQMVADYKAGVALETIAKTLGKSVRSVVAKLSREGVYQAKTRQAQSRTTKANMIQHLEELLGLESGQLQTLEKASYEALSALNVTVDMRCN